VIAILFVQNLKKHIPLFLFINQKWILQKLSVHILRILGIEYWILQVLGILQLKGRFTGINSDGPVVLPLDKWNAAMFADINAKNK